MKSLLVDAIRAANSPAEIETDDTVALVDGEVAEVASNDAADDVEAPVPETDGLELMQTSACLTAAEFDELDLDDELAEESQARVCDQDLSAQSDPVIVDSTSKAPLARSNDVPRFERLARWSPVVCLVIGTTAAALFTVWDATSDRGQLTNLRGHSQYGAGNASAGTMGLDPDHTRFPFLEYRAPDSSAANSNVVENPAKPDAVTGVRTRSPVGTIEFDEHTFTTLSAAYNAYLAGDIRMADIRTLLANRATQADSNTETDIKLLIQRHPESAMLHHALGTLLARTSRWPEARVAFDRAARLSAAGSTK